MRQTVLATEQYRRSLVQRQQAQRVHKVVPQTRIDSVRVLFSLPPFLVDPDQLLSLSRVFTKTIIGDPIKPCGKFRFTAKVPKILVSANERVLREIVCQGEVGAGKLAQQTTHARLMPTDQLAKSVLVVIDKNSSNEVGIG